MKHQRLCFLLFLWLNILLLFGRLHARPPQHRPVPKRSSAVVPANATTPPYRYNICNGFSNQLLYHATSIASAKQLGYQVVHIPNHFIIDGAQTSDDQVYPTSSNSVPFGHVFDQEYFLNVLGDELQLEGQLVTFSDQQQQPPKCKDIPTTFDRTDAAVVRRIMHAFRPSKEYMAPLIDEIAKRLPGPPHQGVCLHHRNGQDWMDHCQRWGSIPDGVYRGNCLQVRQRELSLVQSLATRGLNQSSGQHWIYYCGDKKEIPSELVREYSSSSSSGRFGGIVSHKTMLRDGASGQDPSKSLQLLVVNELKLLSSQFGLVGTGHFRDLWALLDFYICQSLPRFVGNSVSTFSAIQIALRDGDQAFWYNSQSIPLGDFWKGSGVFQIPLVFTYTELSSPGGKYLLQASIESVRRHMPTNRIHILYHGNKDLTFRSWLTSRNVILHNHDPAWRRDIEEMRVLSSNLHNSSHLFSHPGNYFGTWQRIDIPLFMDYEYVLLLDADTVVRAPFGLSDFGLDLTLSIGMSSEMTARDRVPINAGVMLMNIPHLRLTHSSFLRYILHHKSTGGNNHKYGPSDQGAYLGFYKDARYIDYMFNTKPYIAFRKMREYNRARIIHFHGPKPRDYLEYLMGGKCHEAFNFLCERGVKTASKFLCLSLSEFARATLAVDQFAYCQSSFAESSDKAALCQRVLESLAGGDQSCDDFSRVLVSTTMTSNTQVAQGGGAGRNTDIVSAMWAIESKDFDRMSARAFVVPQPSSGLSLLDVILGATAFGATMLVGALVLPRKIGHSRRQRLRLFLVLCLGVPVLNVLRSSAFGESAMPAVLESSAAEHAVSCPTSLTPPASSYLPCLSFPFNSSGCKAIRLAPPETPVTRTPPLTRSSRTAAICLFIKNEHLYINEFVDYHLAIGFSEIIVYDNSPDHNLREWAGEKSVETAGRVAIVHFPGMDKQIPAYEDCFAKLKRERRHTWMTNIDADEMLVMKKHDHVVDLLEEHCASGTLTLYWRVFGHSNQTRYEPLPMAKRFQYASKEPEPLFKTVAKLSDIEGVHVHFITAKSPATQHDSIGTVLLNGGIGQSTTEQRVQSSEVAEIYHYWLKSVEEWHIKACWQGTGYNNTAFLNCKHSMAETLTLGQHHDDHAWKAMKKFLPTYAKLDSSAQR